MTQPRRIAGAILVAGWALMLAWNAPGQLSYDSLSQLADGRAGFYNSWHPPVMAFLLGLFDAALPGTALFLLFQSLLLLLGLLALVWLKPGNGWTVVIALLIVLTPQWLLYQGEIWKDVLFAAAAIAGFAALAWHAHTRHWAGLVLAALLLALAASARQNGIVLLPVAALTLGLAAGRAQQRHGLSGWRLGLVFFTATLALALAANLTLAAWGDGGSGTAAQIRVAQTYDLAGALARDPVLRLPLAQDDPGLDSLLRGRGAGLYSPLHNDPLSGDPAIEAAISAAPQGAISRSWQALVTGQPLLYLRVRVAAFGAVLATPESFACHFSPVGISGPADLLRSLGLDARLRPQDQALADYARLFFSTPVYSHLFWGAAAGALLILLWRRGKPADIAVAGMLAGALLFTLTFVIISIACDYRYLLFLDLSAMAAALYAASGKISRP